MGDVLPFPSQSDDEVVWSCGECECLTFFVHEDGSIACANCGNRHESPVGNWVRAPEDEVKDTPTDVPVIVDLRTSYAALRSIVSRALDDPDEAVAVIVLKRNGDRHMWGEPMEGEQTEWLDKNLAAARAWFVRGDCNGSG